ncbi:MAG: hypothetical protein AMXMBFR60_30860 [Chloroflexota bacterium]
MRDEFHSLSFGRGLYQRADYLTLLKSGRGLRVARIQNVFSEETCAIRVFSEQVWQSNQREARERLWYTARKQV